MSASHIDPERLAALLDGRLDADERAALLAQLEESPEMLQVWADALAVQDELASEDETLNTPVTRRATRRWNDFPASWMVLAAAVLLAIVAPLAWRARRPALQSPMELASRVDIASGPAASAGPPWSQTRGATQPAQRSGRAIRIGARLVDLEVLARANDSNAARVALELSAMMSELPAGGPVAVAFRSLAQRSVSSDPAALRDAISAAEAVAGRNDVRAGAWLEAARLAAVRHDSAFFESSQARAARHALQSLGASSLTAHASEERIRSALAATPPDWHQLELSIGELLRELAA